MREPFRKAQSYFTILLTIEILIGFGIIILTIIYQHLLMEFIADMEKKVFIGQFVNVYVFGLQLILVYIVGIFMWNRLWRFKYTSSLQFFIVAWMLLTLVIIMNGIGTIWSLYNCASALQNSAEMSLRKGMDLYFESPEWKLLWDSLQFHRQCCGVTNYRDWMKASWMAEAKNMFSPDNDTKELEMDYACDDDKCLENARKRPPRSTTSETNSPILAPYACCKQSSSLCFERYMPQVDTQKQNIPALTENDINTMGCLPIFSSTMWILLNALCVCVILVLLLNFLICFLISKIISKHMKVKCEPGDMSFFDDENRQVLYLRYPANITCVTLNESQDPHKSSTVVKRSTHTNSKVQDKKTCECMPHHPPISTCAPAPACAMSRRPPPPPAPQPVKVCDDCGRFKNGTSNHWVQKNENELCFVGRHCKTNQKLCTFCEKHKSPNWQQASSSPCRCPRKINTRILH